MAQDARYSVQFRRRRQGLTDFRKRLALIKSGKPRLVIRKTLNSMIMQVVEFNDTGDRTIASANAGELKKLGWTVSIGNLPAAYLTGMLLAKRAKGKVDEAVLDIGRQHPTKGGRLFAALNGAIDGGLKVPADKSVFPTADRISGKHIKGEAHSMFAKVKESIAKGE